MKKIILLALALPAIAFAQTYPSPTFNSLTLLNALTPANGGTGATTSTGTGSVVLSNSPFLASPTITGSLNAPGLVSTSDLAAQAANTILANASAVSASPTAVAIPSCSGANNALRWASGSGFSCAGAIALTSSGLNQFAATTSTQLAGVISDETGSGSLVFGTNPTLVGATITSTASISQPTAATSSANQNSPNLSILGNYWNGSSSAGDGWFIQNQLGSGANPTSTLAFNHAGSSNTASVSISNLTVPGSASFTTLSASSGINGTAIGNVAASTGAFTSLSSTSPPTVGAATVYPTVANNAALQAFSTAVTGTVTRLGFSAAGDTPPLTYTASASACSLNSGAGDNGSQVKSADNKCWIAKFPPGGADIRWFGAKTGSGNNSTTAFQNAVAASNDVYVPPGQFYMNASVSGISGTLIHGTWSSTLSPFAAGNVLTITNGNFSTIRDLAFAGNSSLSGSGLMIATTDNLLLDNVLAVSFPSYGVICQGTSGTQSSGVSVKNSALLFNGSADLYFSYCNDFHITGNQMGSNVSSPFTGYGIQIVNSGAGQITDNFVWQNAVGISLSSSHYNWISRNRITQSQQSGLVINTGNYNHVTDNQFYTNSLSASAGYPDFALTGGNTTVIDGNQFYSWDGSAHVNYNLTVDGTSSITTVTGNQFGWYVSAPTSISTSAAQTVMSGNSPIQNGTTNNVSTGTFTGVTASAVGGSGSTIYLGNGGSSSTESSVYFPVAAPSAISCLVVASTTAPGAGQSYTVTLRKNAVPTSLTGTYTGSSSFGVNICANGNWVGANPSDVIDLQVVSSSGAPATTFRYSIALQQ